MSAYPETAPQYAYLAPSHPAQPQPAEEEGAGPGAMTQEEAARQEEAAAQAAATARLSSILDSLPANPPAHGASGQSSSLAAGRKRGL